MSGDYYDKVEDQGARLYAAQTARGVQYDEVSGGGWSPERRTKADISAARSGQHIKYDMAAELKASGETKRILLLCDYLFSDAAVLAEKEGWFDLKKKENLKIIRQYACLAIEEMARPMDFNSCAARARYLEFHPKRFIRHHLGNYSKVYQLLDDWALLQFEHAVRRAG